MVRKGMNYTENNRGSIQIRDRARQIIDFSGIRFGNITPTDIDGIIDYHDTAFVLIEMKLVGAEMPYGQRLCIERLVNAIAATGRDACALLCRHNVQDTEQDVKAANAMVEAVYWKKSWHAPIRQMTAKEMIDSFLRFTRNLRTEAL